MMFRQETKVNIKFYTTFNYIFRPVKVTFLLYRSCILIMESYSDISRDLKGLLYLYKNQNGQNTTIAEEIERRILELEKEYKDKNDRNAKRVASKLSIIVNIIKVAHEENKNILEELNKTEYMKVIFF